MSTLLKASASIGLAVALASTQVQANDYYGTLQPFAKESIYFLMTDRFVNGDTTNDFRDQGCDVRCSWEQKINGVDAYKGYLFGDFKGVIDNIDYIKEMGFSSIWITPIIANPNQAFTGHQGQLDENKSGYHGYWGTNFYVEDEHLISPNLKFSDFAATLKNDHDIKVVLDIVANHGSHGYDMTSEQYNSSDFAKVFDQNWNKVCDHENKPREQIVGNACFQGTHDGKPFLGNVPLAEFDQSKQFVVDYLNDSFLHWIEQGAAAFRIDTVKHVPESYWLDMANTIRAQHPDFYMFGEYFDSSMTNLSNFQKATTISVLDFTGKDAMLGVFGGNNSFSALEGYLDLEFDHYKNPYDLATFYDNHDVPRMNASDNGFIDAHNWMFTTRGIPVLYYGSEMGFQRGKAEHFGNRNYYGTDNIANARNSQIFAKLKDVVALRQNNIALQQGLQVNLSLSGDQASFYRVFQHEGVNQSALVLLNKGDNTASFNVNQFLSNGTWTDAETGQTFSVNGSLSTSVAPHDVKVLVFNQAATNAAMVAELDRLMSLKPIEGKNFKDLYVRGTNNNWTLDTPMAFQGDHVWTADATFDVVAGEQMRFKFDVKGDWTQNYGDNNADLVADAGGEDIVISSAGTYTITMNDASLRYTVTPSNPCTEPVLVLAASQVDFGVKGPSETDNQSVAVSNGCAGTQLEVTTVTDDQSWLDASFAANQIQIDIDTSGLADNTYAGTVTVASNGGTETIQVAMEVNSDPVWDKNFNQVFVRGTNNGWLTDEMTLVGHHTWQVTANFGGTTTERFKFDIFGDWSENYGDNEQDGTLERTGADIQINQGAGDYVITMNDEAMSYSVVPANPCTKPEPIYSPTGIDFGILSADQNESSTVAVTNGCAGTTLVIQSVTDDADWLTVGESNLVISASANTAGLVNGNYTATITVTTNVGIDTLPVTLTVNTVTGVTVSFTCHNGHTYDGQSVYVIGDLPELGNWQVANAVKLDPNSYPTWDGDIVLPASTAVAWKCLKREEEDPSKGIVWQGGGDNQFTTPASGSSSVSAGF